MNKSSIIRRLRLALPLLLAILGGLTPAQSQQAPALVIEGGTLIDGNGGTPIQDSVVVIQGNRITSVSRKGQTAAYPANAWVIKADGKYVLPGTLRFAELLQLVFWRSHAQPRRHLDYRCGHDR